MLISAKYEGDKIKTLHADPVGHLIDYTKELRKDDSNGWTKGRTMRHLGRYSWATIEEYRRCNPGWWERTQCSTRIIRDKAWLEFFNSPYGQPTRVVEAAKHG